MIVETCSHPRCFQPKPCPTHKANSSDTKTDTERRFYSSHRWRKTSERHRREEPLCRECGKNNRLTIGQMTDHIVRLRDGGNPFDESNLATLCNPCHDKKRNREREAVSYNRSGPKER